jgi:hypothetical protein
VEALTFDEIVRLINYSRTTAIDLEPFAEKPDAWALYRGKHKVRTSSYPFSVLYLHSRATRDDVASANAALPTGEIHVVYPPSLRQRHSSISKTSFSSCSGLYTTKEYLASFITDEVKIYLKAVSEQSPVHYIDPRIETPSGFPRKIPNPLQSLLVDRAIAGIGADEGVLAVLLAEPGQGKTYMSRYLVSQISTFRDDLIPILVNSTQWYDMPVEDLSSLDKTIVNSFRHFGASIGWLENHEDEFLRTTLKADLFRIVFDGFDEYILRNRGVVQPREVLEALGQLAHETGSRIIITSRTSFWHTSISTTEAADFVEEYGALIYRILPFDLEHAKNYFRKRFTKADQVERATRVFAALNKGNEELVGRGFVLNLIADLIEAVPTGRIIEGEGSAGLLRLMEAFCHRDVLRQELPLNSEQQMSLLRNIATEIGRGAEVTSELFNICIAETAKNLSDEECKMCLERLQPHPLLTYNANSETWQFKEAQIMNTLLADQIVRWEHDQIARFVPQLHMDPAVLQDLGEMIVDLAGSAATDLAAEIKRIIAALCSGKGGRLGSVVALMAIERLLPHGSTLRERSDLLVKLCGGESIQQLDFTGTIARFDFSNAQFRECRFENVSWANCRFSNRTVFNRCEFVGGFLAGRVDGFGTVTLKDAKLDQAASRCFNAARVSEGHRTYAVEDLREDLQALIGKFVSKGGVALKTVTSQNLMKGGIGSSRHKDEIVSAFIGSVLEEHHVSGRRDKGYHVRASAEESVRFYAANNVFTGPLREVFDRLQRKLFR